MIPDASPPTEHPSLVWQHAGFRAITESKPRQSVRLEEISSRVQAYLYVGIARDRQNFHGRAVSTASAKSSPVRSGRAESAHSCDIRQFFRRRRRTGLGQGQRWGCYDTPKRLRWLAQVGLAGKDRRLARGIEPVADAPPEDGAREKRREEVHRVEERDDGGEQGPNPRLLG